MLSAWAYACKNACDWACAWQNACAWACAWLRQCTNAQCTNASVNALMPYALMLLVNALMPNALMLLEEQRKNAANRNLIVNALFTECISYFYLHSKLCATSLARGWFAKDAPSVHPLRSWALEKTPLVWLVQERIVRQLRNSYFWNIFVLVIRDW